MYNIINIPVVVTLFQFTVMLILYKMLSFCAKSQNPFMILNMDSAMPLRYTQNDVLREQLSITDSGSVTKRNETDYAIRLSDHSHAF
jgi:hypothetical protein